jgi:serine phosphatase RsbU (regulator of sigma subunit)
MPLAQSRMQCMQVWGGSRTADASVSTTGLDVWLYSKPYGNHEEGGDVYYLSSCSSGRITRLLLADVRGHGEAVAGLAASLRDLMRRHINHVNQRTLVKSINREFASVGDASTFATGVVGTFFVPTGTFTLSNAGHPPPLWFGSGHQEWRPLEDRRSSTTPTDVPLGIFEHADYGRVDLKLSTEDLVLCFTDGLEDCVDEQGEVLGRDGVRDLVSSIDHRRPERIIPEMLERVTSMSAENLSQDDVTIVLIRPNGVPVPLRNTLLAPFRYLSELVGLRR